MPKGASDREADEKPDRFDRTKRGPRICGALAVYTQPCFFRRRGKEPRDHRRTYTTRRSIFIDRVEMPRREATDERAQREEGPGARVLVSPLVSSQGAREPSRYPTAGPLLRSFRQSKNKTPFSPAIRGRRISPPTPSSHLAPWTESIMCGRMCRNIFFKEESP